jgi:hypothetical protein
MSEQFEHKNLWAEKLQQSSLPDVADQWQSMQGLLNAKMPVKKNKDWRRWLLLVILLLLLIGVCNCPGIMRTNKFSEKNNLPGTDSTGDNKNTSDRKENSSSIAISDSTRMNNGSKINDIDSATKMQSKTQADVKKDNRQKNIGPNITAPANSIKDNKSSADKKIIKQNDELVEGENNYKKETGTYSTKKKNSHHKRVNENNVENDLNNEQSVSNQLDRKKVDKKRKITNVETDSINNVVENKLQNNDSSATIKTHVPIIADSSSKIKKVDTLNKKQSAINQPPKKKTDSTDKKSKRIALAAGLGINQFFTVGSQQHSDYNSSGTSGVLSDYIPVPIVRAYFNKKLYIQLEAQFNTPQYTKSLLASQVIKSDSVGGIPITRPSQNSIFIKKLFYFNIPLSVHYSPLNNFYIGAGVQFSRLTNGVGLFEDKGLTSTGFDSLTLSKVQSFKKDPVYKEIKTNEWRFLLDANYQWKNLVFGVRYNQALNNFINVQISSTQVTQARNSSVQLYLRYILWKNKKTKELLSK